MGVGWQWVNVIEDQYVYRGGTLPAPQRFAEGDSRRAVEAVSGLLGFVGVDFLWDEDEGQATVLEINPRPMSSYVGLSRLLPPGTLARAWIDAVAEHRENGRDDLAEIIHGQRMIVFNGDGAIPYDDVGRLS